MKHLDKDPAKSGNTQGSRVGSKLPEGLSPVRIAPDTDGLGDGRRAGQPVGRAANQTKTKFTPSKADRLIVV